jgi:hypothetical protein
MTIKAPETSEVFLPHFHLLLMVDTTQDRICLSFMVNDKKELLKCTTMGESHRFINADFENGLEICPSPTNFERIEN